MAAFGPASIVIIPFPFSDLSDVKYRPALVLVETGHRDWLLCQITSKAYIDATAVQITDQELERGKLNRVSYARPMKLFTANEALVVKRVAVMKTDAFDSVLGVIIESLKNNLSAA